jgi:Stress up-regulated Nod 19
MQSRRGRAALMLVVAFLLLVSTGCASLAGLGTVDTSQAVTETFRLGPFSLAAMGQPGFESNATQANIPRPAGTLGIKQMSFDVVDSAGAPVSKHDVHLHHVLLMNAGKSDVLCPGRKERFSGSGAERTKIDLWNDYAYLVASGDRWNALWHIMNESDAARTVYIQYTLTYIRHLNASNSRPVTPYFQDVTGCNAGSVFDVPGNGGPGSVFEKSRTWTAPNDGVAIFTGSHLHDGGIEGILKKTSSGEVACRSVVSYHENPRHIDKITPCYLHHTVKAGEQYTLTARYDNSAPLSKVMGINITYVWHGTPPES